MQMQAKEEQDWFQEKISLICDPYFEREFFTNLIFCMDRKKTIREVFEASVKEIECGQVVDDWNGLENSLLHFFYAYEVSQQLRESYQWLPIFQGLYTVSLFRSGGDKPLQRHAFPSVSPRGSTPEELQKMIRRSSRRVESKENAWRAFLFLLNNRSTRARALDIFLRELAQESDTLTVSLMLKVLDICFAHNWKDSEVLLYRAFDRFWRKGLETGNPASAYEKAQVLMQSGAGEFQRTGSQSWNQEWAEELWHRASKESEESAWEWILKMGAEGVSLDQIFCLLHLLRGRALYLMELEQWSLLINSALYGEALKAASRWMPSMQMFFLAMNLVELCQSLRLMQFGKAERPRGDSLKETYSENLGKNQLVLRLDDAVERGDRQGALELLALIVEDRGLTQNLSDRLLLVASKQDGWTYDQSTLPLSSILVRAYQFSHQMHMDGDLPGDCLFGLLRFLSEQRQYSLRKVAKRGHYGDHLTRSNFDVSSGARIVDRFVFNQARNAQRIFVWPTEGKG